MSLTAPKALRLQIALTGKVNAGKSSFLNLITGQETAIASAVPGTTTDVVEKNQELLPIGPVTWLDTAGFGDDTELSVQRIEKTRKVFDRADVILLVTDSPLADETEQAIIVEAEKRKLPVLKIYNKADTYTAPADGIAVNSLDKASRDKVLVQLKSALLRLCPDDFIHTPPLFGDLVPAGSSVLLLIPIDKEAPKGRLIMPQVQAIREGLDYNLIVSAVTENRYAEALAACKKAPDLVICDSQIVDFMTAHTPPDIKCTTFSTLFARLKGDLGKFAEGAAVISKLKDGDKVLIAECCTHHAVEDDIGKVKIPHWLKEKTGKNLQIDFCAGRDFPDNLSAYRLVIQCGGCMFGRREILARINACEAAGVAITNYGIGISEMKNVLPRILEPFGQVFQDYKMAKNS
ncbi:MAG: [FeFe] hydrogenase H-cluster maturation GTPase HydF [Alphaproteobacteria bacterium]|nr:[FeFe] hydrogenase H-cluster maturation GTPase HydF [Alphaproteobacteria bacterium]